LDNKKPSYLGDEKPKNNRYESNAINEDEDEFDRDSDSSGEEPTIGGNI